jgi:hypothetical protein
MEPRDFWSNDDYSSLSTTNSNAAPVTAAEMMATLDKFRDMQLRHAENSACPTIFTPNPRLPLTGRPFQPSIPDSYRQVLNGHQATAHAPQTPAMASLASDKRSPQSKRLYGGRDVDRSPGHDCTDGRGGSSGQ